MATGCTDSHLAPRRQVLLDGGTDLLGNFGIGRIYDPVTPTFVLIGSPPPLELCCGYWDAATLLPNGNVLLAGGGNGDFGFAFASAAPFDPASGMFIPTGNITTARLAHKAVLLLDGTVLVTGGDGGCCRQVRNGAELYLYDFVDPLGNLPPMGAAVIRA